MIKHPSRRFALASAVLLSLVAGSASAATVYATYQHPDLLFEGGQPTPTAAMLNQAQIDLRNTCGARGGELIGSMIFSIPDRDSIEFRQECTQ
jgi:hypothetical protein